MSKSLGNVTYPKDIIQKYNVDTLRWWVAAHLIGQSQMSVKPHLFDDSANAILKIRKVLRYLVGYVEKLSSTNNQTPHQFNIQLDSLTPLDTYMLNSLAQFEAKAKSLAENYRFPIYINNINKFVSDDLSAFYIDIIKDRMYSNSPKDTIQTMNVLFAQFCILNKVIWPIVPHLVEEVWSYYNKTNSFYSQQFTVPNEWHNPKYDSTMKLVKQIIAMLREKVTKTTWNFDITILAGADDIQELQVNYRQIILFVHQNITFFNFKMTIFLFDFQKLHPDDEKSHNDSHLCEILQVQSIQLRQSSNNQLSVERRDIEKKICDRCRRFTITTDEVVCKRCHQVLNNLND